MSRTKKDLNDITAAPFWVFFAAGSWEKDTENGAAVTSLRSILFRDNFSGLMPNLTKNLGRSLWERAFSFLKVFDSLWGYANTVDERANNRKVYTIWSWGWHLHFRHSSKNFLWLTNNRLPIRLHPIKSQKNLTICKNCHH